jgi:hypothetical protein
MEKHSQTHPSDRTLPQHAGADHSFAQHAHKEVNFGEVGNRQANHAIAQMTGRDSEAHAHQQKGSGKGIHERSHLNFAAHDIYASPGRSGQHSSREVHAAADRPTGAHEANTHPGQSTAGMDGTGGKDGGDRINESASATDAKRRPPELYTPTPEQLAHDPVDKLQTMVKDNREALNNWMGREGEHIPTIVTHGTHAEAGRMIEENKSPGGRLNFGAGQTPDRLSMGPAQRVADLGASMDYSLSFARGDKSGQKPGPVHVFKVDADLGGFGRDRASHSSADSSPGSNEGYFSQHGQFHDAKTPLVGTVTRQRIDHVEKQYAPLEQAINEYKAQPGGLNEARYADIVARGQVLRDNKNLVMTSELLNAVAPSNDNEF